MFDTIILLTDPIEQPVFTSLLLEHRPDLTIISAVAAEDIAALDRAQLRRARLIAFTTPVIVPQDVLDDLGFGAYNFHPGSPDYPGWAPAHFAVYDQAEIFGATLHAMVGRVDAGPIIDANLFDIPPDIDVLDLEAFTYRRLAAMFWRYAKALATQSSPLQESSHRWGSRRSTRRRYRDMCDIPLTIPKDEFDRRIKVFGGNHFGIAPTIQLHGIRFQAVTAAER
jgi:methionyl-tRNA formyltransferase